LRIPFGRSYWVRPGLLLAGAYPGDEDRNIAAQKLQALLACGIKHIINLMEAGETNEYGQPFVPYEKDFKDFAKAKGIEALVSRIPIKDVSVPAPETMKAILNEISRSIAANRPVYIHCWGGRGRTGTVVGCYLVRHGLTGKEALKRIRELRRDEPTADLPSPQTGEQEEMVLNWEEFERRD
jgi:Polymorphic toxin system, DSP-PTPase phosphatase